MNIDISNAHCGPRILFLDHSWLRVVPITKTARSSLAHTREDVGARWTRDARSPRRHPARAAGEGKPRGVPNRESGSPEKPIATRPTRLSEDGVGSGARHLDVLRDSSSLTLSLPRGGRLTADRPGTEKKTRVEITTTARQATGTVSRRGTDKRDRRVRGHRKTTDRARPRADPGRRAGASTSLPRHDRRRCTTSEA